MTGPTTSAPYVQPPARVDVDGAYREHGSRCFSLALRIVGDRHLAEDVVQAAFASLTRADTSYDPARGSLGSWLMTITHHRAVDLVRSRRIKTGLDSTYSDHFDVISLNVQPDDSVVLEESARRVRDAVAGLDQKLREVLLHAYFGGLAQSEIATLLDLPLGTVKSRTLAAMRQLRLALGSERDGPFPHPREA